MSLFVIRDIHCEHRSLGVLFSLFSVVNFHNSPCRSTVSLTGSSDNNRNGTCYTSSECGDKGGEAEGNCAAGFGVCCIFQVRGEEGDTYVNENCTYIQNPGFDSPYTDVDDITYTVNKLNDDVCQLRLDFEIFSILGIATVTATPPNPPNQDGDACSRDSLTINGVNNHQIPVICGFNSGQHIYVDAADPTTLDFSFDSTSTDPRRWDIKVSQIECTNPSRAPNGCLQYHTTMTGRITTFNFAEGENRLNNQQYSICLRSHPGTCCVQYSVCPDQTMPFSISAMLQATQDDLCLTGMPSSYITISNSGAFCNQGTNLATDSRYCGMALSVTTPSATESVPICDCTAPFVVDITTAPVTATPPVAGSQRGVCLDYMQVACQ